MNSYQGDLWLLLRLMEDSLSAADRVRAERLLAGPGGQARWQLLKRASRENPLSMATAGDSNRVSADRIAAYVEQQLPDEEAQQVESACWQSLPDLCEVVSIFRFIRRYKPQAVGSALTERLLDLTPDTDAPNVDPFAHPNSQTPAAKPANGQQVDWQSRLASVGRDEFPIDEDDLVTRRLSPRRRRSQLIWSLAAGLAVVVICMAGVALLLSQKEQAPTATEKKDDEKQSPGDDNDIDDGQRFVDQKPPKERPQTQHNPEQDGTEENGNDPVVHDESNWQRELRLPDDWQLREDWLAPDEDEPEVEPPKRPTHKPIQLAWDRIEGVVAAHDESSGGWHGVEYGKRIGKIDSTFATFPDSWAQTSSERFGQFVLAPDTQLSFGLPSADESQVELSVVRGRLAMHKLPVEREVILQVGKSRWSVRTAEPESIVAVDVMSARPRIFVPEGEAVVDGQVVAARKQVVWTPSGWESPQSINRRENTAWTERPPVGLDRLNAKVQQRLLQSNDLIADLNAADGLDARLATRWSLALAPQDALARMSSPDAAVRVEAFRWLLSLHARDRRFSLALRQFVAAAGNPQLVRSLSNLIRDARQGQLPGMPDIQQALGGLRHRQLAVRHFSAYVIEVTFGTTTEFVADAPAAVRNSQADSIARELQRIYRAAAQRGALQRAAAQRGAAANNNPAQQQQQRPNANNRQPQAQPNGGGR